jgi:hypothetical protein
MLLGRIASGAVSGAIDNVRLGILGWRASEKRLPLRPRDGRKSGRSRLFGPMAASAGSAAHPPERTSPGVPRSRECRKIGQDAAMQELKVEPIILFQSPLMGRL